MIRPILAMLIAAFILLFVSQYANFTERIRPDPISIVETAARGRYDVRFICTFDCQGNAFGNPAVSIKFRDRVLIDHTDLVEAGESIVVEGVPDIKEGLNDFLVQVTPVESATASPSSAFGLDPVSPANRDEKSHSYARAVLVEVLHDGYVIARQTMWSDASGPFGELITIQVGPDKHEHSDR